MSMTRNSTLFRPAEAAVACACAIAVSAMSNPTNRDCGAIAAMLNRLAPSPQPTSRTRQREAGAKLRPYRHANVPIAAGCVDGCGEPGYRIRSYAFADGEFSSVLILKSGLPQPPRSTCQQHHMRQPV